jgi:MYXO-CTERM domain-containing protein
MNRRLGLVLTGSLFSSATAHAAPDLAPTLSDPDNRPVMLTVKVEPGPQNMARQSIPLIAPVLYMNRCTGGCTVRPGPDDARTSTTSIAEETVTLSEFRHGDDTWDATVECVREVLSPYAITVVTDDPGQASHHRAIVAGTADELGLPRPPEGEIGGVGLLASDCRPLDNVMSFTFANTLQDNVIDLCWTVVHEAGHAFGLDHVYACADPMTYIPGCGTKYFRDEPLVCGEFEERACQCGARQNSHEHLTGVFGEGTLPPPPTVRITNLQDGGSISDGAEVAFTASHVRGVRRVLLRINGTRFGEIPGNAFDEGESYRLRLPHYPDGVLRIEAVAQNDLGVEGSDEVTVTKGEPCTRDDQCFEEMACIEGGCAWPPPHLELGEPCEHERECISGLCPSSGGERYCSQLCVPGAEQCPGGLECRGAGTQGGACWPEGAGSGCGCRAGGPSSAFSFALVMLAAGVLLRRRRTATPA